MNLLAQAPEPDMFAGDRLEFVGVLRADAELRSKPVGDAQHIMPVLCMDLATVGTGAVMHAEQIFTESTRKHAEALVSQLKKGKRVTLTSTLLDLRLMLPHVEHVQLAE